MDYPNDKTVDLQAIFSTALNFNSDPEFAQPRNADTVTSNAIDSLQPIKANGGEWGDFWKGAAATTLNYALLKDATRSGLTSSSVQQSIREQGGAGEQRARQGPNMGTALLIGGGLVAVLLVAMVLRKG